MGVTVHVSTTNWNVKLPRSEQEQEARSKTICDTTVRAQHQTRKSIHIKIDIKKICSRISQELADGTKTVKAISCPIVGYEASQECLLQHSIQHHPLVCREFVLEVEMLLRHL